MLHEPQDRNARVSAGEPSTGLRLRAGSREARASLRRALEYRCDAVVERFRGEYPMARRDAEEVWRETKRWLWLCGCFATDAPLFVTPSMTVIDEMWHAFVLFTGEYTAFCTRHFGRYIHHAPTTHEDLARERREYRADAAGVTRRFEDQRRAQYEVITEYLGERTLRRWYVDYAKRYSPAQLRRLQRRALAGD